MGSRTHDKLNEIGYRILGATRTELYLSMRFMGAALGSLDFRMDLSTRTVGTDAVSIRFNPTYLMQMYVERPELMNRMYMHMLMHCIFRHMFSAKEHEDSGLWDLCCDIAAESVVDSMNYPSIRRVSSDLREEWYGRLHREVHTLTAEKLYHYLILQKRDPYIEESLRQEFAVCDHSFWERMQDAEDEGDAPRQPGSGQGDSSDQPGGGEGNASRQPGEGEGDAPRQPESGRGDTSRQPEEGEGEAPRQPDTEKDGNSDGRKDGNPVNGGTGNSGAGKAKDPADMERKAQEWKDHAKRIQSELEHCAKDASEDAGGLSRLLAVENRKRIDYKEYLKKFAVIREENRVDPDSFDYGFYMYGLSLYDNMPLVEENEFCESRRVETLVIAIDTSASCQASLVQKFLNETGALLRSQETFFHRIDVHIIECDNQVQKDIPLKHVEELEQYAAGVEVRGGYGTDFRPVFAHVEKLQRQGQLLNLRGLMYFTDGFGTYPDAPPPYETAFVFMQEEEYEDAGVPGWALKLYLNS